VLEGIAETLKTVLPYASDLRPAITKELQRSVYLRLYEAGLSKKKYYPVGCFPRHIANHSSVTVFAAPDAAFNHFVEELENGLDPRTIHL